MADFKHISTQLLKHFDSALSSWLTYHNSTHTNYVIEQAEFIGLQEKLSKNDILLVKFAALYHDSGFLIQREDHERLSCEIATRELKLHGFDATEIDRICGMIIATHIPQQPKTHLEKIVADADLQYLGTNNFEEFSSNFFKEIKHFQPELTRKEWDQIQIDFISSHTYHTNYGRKHLEPVKRENLQKVKQRQSHGRKC
ncbi:HD domain-containing protein [Salinimicrobium sp. GXAS 041]|uniref:HD domain-containing protein n=1 Tax=Salinimicrobium sp. GXAS 041 TaxID=3400806 RepID=UPI003C75CC09